MGGSSSTSNGVTVPDAVPQPAPDAEWVEKHLRLECDKMTLKFIATDADVSRTSAYLCAHCEEVESFEAKFSASR